AGGGGGPGGAGGRRERAGAAAGVLEGAALDQEGVEPAHLVPAAVAARLAEEILEGPPLGGGGDGEEADQHEGPLALPEVAGDLLAVLGVVADQVQEVVLDLEGGAQEPAEAVEAVAGDSALAGAERPHPPGIRAGGPRGL